MSPSQKPFFSLSVPGNNLEEEGHVAILHPRVCCLAHSHDNRGLSVLQRWPLSELSSWQGAAAQLRRRMLLICQWELTSSVRVWGTPARRGRLSPNWESFSGGLTGILAIATVGDHPRERSLISNRKLTARKLKLIAVRTPFSAAAEKKCSGCLAVSPTKKTQHKSDN